jgi:exosome complex component RRP42
MQMKTNNEEYMKELLGRGTREYGRAFLDYRKIDLKANVLPQAEGSAMVSIGNTMLLTGIKLAVGEPMKDKPYESSLITSAELLPLASSEFEAGPPSPSAVEFARVVDRGIRAAGIIDSESMFIEEGKVWNIYVDIYVLNFDGNLFDAGTLSGVAALLTAKQPLYENGEVVRDSRMGLMKTKGIVTSCTFAKVGDRLLLDPDREEEAAMSSRLTIANDPDVIRAMQKGLSGSFSPAEVEKAIDITFEKSKDLRSIVKKAVGD